MHIIIDNRENPKRIKKLIAELSPKDTYSVEALAVGDYHLCTREGKLLTIIEYKTISDFVQSYRRGHIQSQIEDLKKDLLPFIIVTGKESTVLNPRAYIRCTGKELIGMKTSLALSGISYMSFDTEGQGLQAIISLGRKLESNPDSHREYKVPERCVSSGDLEIDMLITIPGIGMKYAYAIKEMYSFEEFINLCRDPVEACLEFKRNKLNVPKKSIIAVANMINER